MERLINCCHDFYLHVAKLFYAVANIDGNIREEEYDALKNTLKNEWIHKYKGKKPVVDEILNCFQLIVDQKEKAEDSFKEFIAYKKKHEKLFTNQMKNTLWQVSCEIADSVNKKNKSELIILVHLGKQLGLMK